MSDHEAESRKRSGRSDGVKLLGSYHNFLSPLSV